MILKYSVLFLTIFSACSGRVVKVDNFELVILHNNDMHSRFEETNVFSAVCSKQEATNNQCYGGFARVAYLVNYYRTQTSKAGAPAVLYLNAGDSYTGSLWFTLYKENITAEFMNKVKPDVMSLGNHEFDEGVPSLRRFLDQVTFPLVASNINVDKEPLLKVKNLIKSVIVVKNGVKIGIIGYLTPETKVTSTRNNVEYYEEIVSINAESPKLKSQGANIIIVLGHSGFLKDKEIAAKCPDVDLVIGGHSHTFLYTGTPPSIERPTDTYPVMITQPSGKVVPVVQAYAYTKYLGVMRLQFNSKGDLLKFEGSPILLDGSVPQEETTLKLLEKYRPGVEKWRTDVIGTTKVFLNGFCRRSECNLGNIFTDSLRLHYIRNFGGDQYTIGLSQAGILRASIDATNTAGNITREAVLTVLPFNNRIVLVKVPGRVILQALEHSVRRYNPDGIGEFLQMSGMNVVFDLSKPSGSRIVEAKVNKENIQPDRVYKISMPAFLAQGGDGFTMFEAFETEDLGTTDLEVTVKYMGEISPIDRDVEGRVVLKNVQLYFQMRRFFTKRIVKPGKKLFNVLY